MDDVFMCWLTYPEAATYSKASRSKLYQEVRAGRLKVYKFGARSLLRRSELDALIEAGAAPAAAGGAP
jgi:excisionase family DNA binding protein